MPKRENKWLKFSHHLPPESVWQRIGHPVAILGGFAFIVASSLPSSPLAKGGRIYMMMRYDAVADKIVQAGDNGAEYTFRDRKQATDALIHYQARSSTK